MPRLSVLSSATCTGLFADNWLAVSRATVSPSCERATVVLATGCVEQPMVFRNNDLPGVMLASRRAAADAAVGGQARPAAVVVTANPEGYAAALDLLDAGVTLQAVLDLRRGPRACPGRDELLARGVRVRDGWTVTEALPGRAGPRLEGVVIDRVTGEGATAGNGIAVACDLVVTTAGVAPLGQLACDAGARFVYDEELASFRVEKQPADVQLAGGVDQRDALAAVLADGCGGCGRGPSATAIRGRSSRTSTARTSSMSTRTRPTATCATPWRTGRRQPELAKRYTTIAMGPSRAASPPSTPCDVLRRAGPPGADARVTTTQRPPFLPESFGHLAGRGLEPTRLTAMHHQHRGARRPELPAGLWYRPAYYGACDRARP